MEFGKDEMVFWKYYIIGASSNKYMKMFQTEGWALPACSNFRFSLEQKNMLYKCFMDGEKTGNKVSPEEMSASHGIS